MSSIKLPMDTGVEIVEENIPSYQMTNSRILVLGEDFVGKRRES